MHDRHAEREESNYGVVGEDISYGVGKREKKKTYFEGMDCTGWRYFLWKRDLFIYRIRVSSSVF